jgi:thymidylate kinase
MKESKVLYWGSSFMKPKLIVVEGADGVGKTYLCKKLAKEKGWFYLKTPPKVLSKIKCKTPEEELIRYLDGVILNSITIQKKLSSKKTVICDRYYITFLVDLKLARINLDVSKLLTFLPKPNQTILLEEKYGVVVERLKQKKNKSKLEKEIIDDKKMYDKVVKLFREMKTYSKNKFF